jgi:hypothetical protein
VSFASPNLAEICADSLGDPLLSRKDLPRFQSEERSAFLLWAQGQGSGYTREKQEVAVEDPDKTEEVFLLAYSPLLHDYALQQLVSVLQNTVTTIDSASCMLGDIRIDKAECKIYGRGHKIQTYGEYI